MNGDQVSEVIWESRITYICKKCLRSNAWSTQRMHSRIIFEEGITAETSVIQPAVS